MTGLLVVGLLCLALIINDRPHIATTDKPRGWFAASEDDRDNA